MFKALISMLSDNFAHAKQTVGMAQIDLKKRYSSSTLGIVWAMIKPALFVLVYWFGIEIGIRGGASKGDTPFILWLLAGILPWFFITDTLINGGMSVRNYRHLVTKSVFPIPTIPTFVELSFFEVHLMLTATAAVIFAVCGYMSVYFIQILYCLLCLFVLMWVLSVFFSALVVVSRDFEYLLKSATQILFWISPILWEIERIEKYKWIYYIVRINPISYIVGIYRNAFLGGWCFTDVKGLVCFWVEMIVLGLIASFVFKRLEHEFADIL